MSLTRTYEFPGNPFLAVAGVLTYVRTDTCEPHKLRWTELRLMETADGEFVAFLGGMSIIEGETHNWAVLYARTLPEMEKLLRRPGGRLPSYAAEALRHMREAGE